VACWRLAADLKLPKFKEDGNRYQYSWPPPQPNLALASMPPDPFIGSEAAKGTYIEARNKRFSRTTDGKLNRRSRPARI
jgi:hypothetical protein